MSKAIERLFDAARALPEAERIRLAERLLATAEPEPEADVAAAWSAEIERRTSELESGSVRPIPWTEVQTTLRKARARR